MNCYYVASDQPRYVRNRHVELHAEDDTCRGCVPCTERHCLRCNREHVEQLVCPGCIADAREDLAEIVRMCAALPIEVRHRGINSEAMNLLGPVADPESVGHVRASINVGRIDAGWLEEADNENHPLLVLGGWGECYIEALDHDEPERWTVASAASYLDRNLAYVAQLDDVPFDDLARDLARCRNHIERVLHDGEQVETGAPCMTCRIPLRLVRGEREDRWTCPRCRQESTEEQYRFALRADFIENATDLNADDMAVRTEVPASTIRRWAHVRRTQRKGEKPIDHPPIIKPTGRVNERKVYAVVDVEFVRDNGGEALRDSPDAPAARSVA